VGTRQPQPEPVATACPASESGCHRVANLERAALGYALVFHFGSTVTASDASCRPPAGINCRVLATPSVHDSEPAGGRPVAGYYGSTLSLPPVSPWVVADSGGSPRGDMRRRRRPGPMLAGESPQLRVGGFAPA
jgi:hypothetical protein